jgi:hypothetical protein
MTHEESIALPTIENYRALFLHSYKIGAKLQKKQHLAAFLGFF